MYWIVFMGGSLILRLREGKHELPQSEEPPTPTFEWTNIMELPPYHGIPCRTYTLKSPPREGLPSDFVTVGLRESYYLIPREAYNLASKASELNYWDSNTHYCGVCGDVMRMHTAISKRCNNCGKEIWPQVSPAIIVRIKRNLTPDIPSNEEILLVHARNFRKNFYGLVAGFLETGETLEECVEREVWEETHIRIHNIKYFGSQAWPYPSGIMVGFTADYLDGDIQLQEEELSQGGWFKADNLPAIPDPMSIARQLIDDWAKQAIK